MKMVVLTILAAIASPLAAVAQHQPPTLDHPSARNLIGEQLDEVATRIQHRETDGRLSHEQAVNAQREVYDLQSELADERLRDGGQLNEGDRFALQEKVRQLILKIDQESADGPQTVPHP
jgi:hypothetical protein